MTLTYYPSLLAYVAATLAYVLHAGAWPATGTTRPPMPVIVVYWVARRWCPCVDVGLVARALERRGCVMGTPSPAHALVLLGTSTWCRATRRRRADDRGSPAPRFAGLASLVLIVNNFLSYAGMEVNAVHGPDLKDPGEGVPARRCSWPCAGGRPIFVLPALAITWVVPSRPVDAHGGVMQAFRPSSRTSACRGSRRSSASCSSPRRSGGMMAWLAGPSKGLLQIGRKEGYLPPFLQKVNRHGVQVNILFAQGAIVSVIALLFALIPNVHSVYWIFSVITTQVYLIMYLLMFIAGDAPARDAARPPARLSRADPAGAGHRRPRRVGAAPSPSASCRRRSSAAAARSSTWPSSSAAWCSSAWWCPFLLLWLRKPGLEERVPARHADGREGVMTVQESQHTGCTSSSSSSSWR